jgi:4'-phosphopantetheinyl transferase
MIAQTTTDTLLAPTTIHPVIMPVPPEDRLLKGREMVAALRRHARTALQQSCRISGKVLGSLEKTAAGAPLPSNGLYWSVTHKQANVAAVVAPHPVGIDIEALRPCNPSLHRRIADDREWALAPEVSDRLFFRFWTAKEAVLKAMGTGLTGLEHCRIQKIVDDTHMALTYDDVSWLVNQYWAEDRHLLAVTMSAEMVKWHVVN